MEYEGLPHVCCTCDKYVHNSDLCPKRTTESCQLEALGRNLGDNKVENTGAVAATVNFGSNPKFGSWMVVTWHGQWSSHGKESRFEVLARSMKKNLIVSETWAPPNSYWTTRPQRNTKRGMPSHRHNKYEKKKQIVPLAQTPTMLQLPTACHMLKKKSLHNNITTPDPTKPKAMQDTRKPYRTMHTNSTFQTQLVSQLV